MVHCVDGDLCTRVSTCHICKDLAACWTSFFAISIINFPVWRIFSPTLIGRIPRFLLRGIKQFAMNASRVSPTSLIEIFKFLVQNVLVKFGINFRRSKKEDPNYLETSDYSLFSVKPWWVTTSQVSSVNSKIPLLVLFVNYRSVLLAFPFCIKCLDFIDIFSKFIGVLVDRSLCFFAFS